MTANGPSTPLKKVDGPQGQVGVVAVGIAGCYREGMTAEEPQKVRGTCYAKSQAAWPGENYGV